MIGRLEAGCSGEVGEQTAEAAGYTGALVCFGTSRGRRLAGY